MPDVFAELDDLSAQAAADLAAVASADALEQYRIKYLGGKGLLKAKMSLIGQAPPDQKKAVGQRLNEVKQRITGAFEAKQGELADQVGEDGVDVTEPGVRPAVGNKHILMKVIGELTDLFGRMGFSVAAGPEVEDEFHNFVALNIPESHPARDPLDNFYLEESGSGVGGRGSGNRRAAPTTDPRPPTHNPRPPTHDPPSACSAPRRRPCRSGCWRRGSRRSGW
jgi:phenylalanyl-tRNA synthetase alpha chain